MTRLKTLPVAVVSALALGAVGASGAAAVGVPCRTVACIKPLPIVAPASYERYEVLECPGGCSDGYIKIFPSLKTWEREDYPLQEGGSFTVSGSYTRFYLKQSWADGSYYLMTKVGANYQGQYETPGIGIGPYPILPEWRKL